MSISKEVKDYLKHFPKKISKDLVDFVTNEALLHSRYIFTHREKKKQYGYCTHCKSEFETVGLKHNKKTTCPHCNSTCIVKASGMKRSRLYDEAFVVFYEKSAIDPKVIVARGMNVERNYSGDYKQVETQYVCRYYYIFEMGKPVMLKSWWSGTNFDICSSVFSGYYQGHNNSWDMKLCCSHDSIKKAIAGTPFQYSMYDSFYENNADMVEYFALYAKYPCIEYLTKFGFKNLVEDKLYKNNTYGAINWKGKTFNKVLRLSKKELEEIKAANVDVTSLFLRLYQISKKDGSNFSSSELSKVSVSDFNNYSDLQKVLKYASLRQTLKYAEKQLEKNKGNYYYSKSRVISTWKDYINDCIELEMDLTKDSVLFPKDLYKAHQNTLKKVKYLGDELLNKKIQQRLDILQRYCFEDSGIMIRPAESTEELIKEGNALDHCVGGYAKSYANGRTIILLIRKVDAPDKPLCTMEISSKNVIKQVRAKSNRDPKEDVNNFVEVFKKKILTVKESKKKKTA